MTLLLSKVSNGKSGRLIIYDGASHLEPIVEWLDGYDKARLLVDVSNIIKAYCQGPGHLDDDYDYDDLGSGIEVDIDGNYGPPMTATKTYPNSRMIPFATTSSRNESFLWQGKAFFLRHICPM